MYEEHVYSEIHGVKYLKANILSDEFNLLEIIFSNTFFKSISVSIKMFCGLNIAQFLLSMTYTIKFVIITNSPPEWPRLDETMRDLDSNKVRNYIKHVTTTSKNNLRRAIFQLLAVLQTQLSLCKFKHLLPDKVPATSQSRTPRLRKKPALPDFQQLPGG